MVRSPALPSLTALEQVLAVDPAILRGYARGVGEELSRGPLTLDRRDRLIGRAKHLGLSRFEAALVLAVTERNPPIAPPPAAAKFCVQRAQRSSLLSMFTLAAAVQATIVAAAWWVVA